MPDRVPAGKSRVTEVIDRRLSARLHYVAVMRGMFVGDLIEEMLAAAAARALKGQPDGPPGEELE